jgi:hypothetical protein
MKSRPKQSKSKSFLLLAPFLVAFFLFPNLRICYHFRSFSSNVKYMYSYVLVMEPKDIDISLSEGVLTIKGEKKQEKEEKEEGYHLIERSYGSFTRSIQLPKDVQ